jgi:hypothetical protein
MPDGVIVLDAEGMATLIARLDQLRSHFDSIKKTQSSVNGVFGQRSMEDAYDEFVNGWRDGRVNIKAELEDHRRALHEALTRYLEAEGHITELAGGT